jgi:hypothetical protein
VPVLAATVIAGNYVPHARVLAASLRRWHPDARLVVLVVDAEEAVALDGVDVLTPRDVGIGARELHRRALLYDAQGVISSLRWWLLRHLLGDGPVVLLDADMLVLGRLDDLWRLVPQDGVLLSPHAVAPVAGEPGAWPEEEMLRSGTFSGGLVGAGPGATSFVEWMCERTQRDCLRAPERGLLYGQTWLNLVPAVFEHHILRDPGVNAQLHGLAGQDVEIDDAGAVRLGETAVRLFHFAGFDPDVPERLCRYYAGTEMSDRPGLARLCRDYAKALRGAGWPAAGPWRWDVLPGGIAVDEAMRSVYRDALLSDADEPPDPFDAHDPDAFRGWLRTPASSSVVPRYLLALHGARRDLQTAFPKVPGDDAPAYLAWAASKVIEPGQRELAAQLVPGAASAPT